MLTCVFVQNHHVIICVIICIIILQVPGNGNCFVQAVIEQLKLADEHDAILYTSMYVCRQVITHILGSYDTFKDKVKEFVRNEYGRIDSQEGPFSLKS